MRVAVVTLAVGQAFLDRWKFQCEAGWRAYCQRHNYDLVVLDEMLDDSPRAQRRSPSWQKCLILRAPALAAYDRVIWVDADVVINPQSPPIVSNVPIEKIGAVDEFTYPTPETREQTIKCLIEHWRGVDKRVSDNWTSFLDPADWHAFAGLPRRGQHIIQAGVLVLSPRCHRELLEHVYDVYEDSGGGEMNYEMRPLSFEIQENGLQYWIDSRFNALVYLLLLQSELILKRPLSSNWQLSAFLKSEYARNYFLHFAGRQDLMRLLTVDGQEPSASKSLSRNAPCPCGSGKRYKHCHGRYAT